MSTVMVSNSTIIVDSLFEIMAQVLTSGESGAAEFKPDIDIRSFKHNRRISSKGPSSRRRPRYVWWNPGRRHTYDSVRVA